MSGVKIHLMSIRALLVCSILGVGACGDTTDAGSRPPQIVLDLHRLVVGAVPPPDFVSVLDTARLRVAAAGQEASQVVPLGQSEATATFDVTVPSGSVRFRLDVFSNNLTPLYVADTTVTVGADNFAIRIRPDTVNGVMVVWPRNPPYTTSPASGLKSARWMLRNAGNLPLQWSVDTVASDGVFQCTVYPSQANCKVPLTLNPSPPTTADTVEVVFASIDGPARIITFKSNVGQASFATGIP